METGALVFSVFSQDGSAFSICHFLRDAVSPPELSAGRKPLSHAGITPCSAPARRYASGISPDGKVTSRTALTRDMQKRENLLPLSLASWRAQRYLRHLSMHLLNSSNVSTSARRLTQNNNR